MCHPYGTNTQPNLGRVAMLRDMIPVRGRVLVRDDPKIARSRPTSSWQTLILRWLRVSV
jgi:hypothetical protein